MSIILDYPLLTSAISFIALWSAALAGDFVRRKVRPLGDDLRNDLEVVQTALRDRSSHS
jgi:hypothetical protein